MRFLVKRNLPTEGDQNQRGLPGTQTSYELPNGTITWLSIIYLIVQTFGASLGGTISNYFNNKPQQDINSKSLSLREQNFKVQLLQRCLELDSTKDRRLSLELLANTDFFSENEKRLLHTFVEANATYAPKWRVRDIEALNSYLINSSGSALSFPNPPLSTTTTTGTGTNTPNAGGSTPTTGGSTPTTGGSTPR